MSFGKPSWIITHLLGTHVEVARFRVEETLYGSTAGPWGGVGGAAMSSFTMTLFELVNGDVIVYADEAMLGWAPASRAGEVIASFPRYNLSVNLRKGETLLETGPRP